MTLEELKNKMQRSTESSPTRFTREMTVDENSINKEEMYAEFSVSSEYPVRRWFGYEILDHSTTSIRMGRLLDGAAHRDGHTGDQIGIVTKAWIDQTQRKLRVGVKFSKNTARAGVIFNDIVDGIRKNVSIDYSIYEITFEKEVEDMTYYRIMDWEPIHTCNTPDGADPSVGMGRSNDSKPTAVPLDLSGDVQKQIDEFNRSNESGLKIVISNNQNRSKQMTEEEKKRFEEAQRAAEEQAKKDAGERETLRIRGIRMMAGDLKRTVPHLNLDDEAEKYVAQGKSEREFYDFISAEMKNPKAVRTPDGHIDASEKDKKDYSFSRAILALADNKVHTLGIEREMSDTLAKKLGRDTKGLLIPTNMLDTDASVFRGKRAAQQNAGTPSAGGYTINEQLIAQSYVEYLANTLIATQAGVTFLPGMAGIIPFVKELDELSFSWQGESVAPAASAMSFAREEVGPKLGGSKTSISRQLLLQSEYVSEAMVRRKLINASRKGIDRAIFYGNGLTQPLGIKNVTGVHSIIGTDYDRAKAISQKSAIRTDNAEIGAVNFVTNPNTTGVLQSKAIAANYPAFLCNDDQVMVARKVLDSNQIDEGDLFYGVFATILLLEWGYLDVSVNPYGQGWDAGDIDVRALTAVNTFFEYPQSLSVAEEVN